MADIKTQSPKEVLIEFSPEEASCLKAAQALLKESLPTYGFQGEGLASLSPLSKQASFTLTEDIVREKYFQCVRDQKVKTR